MTPIIKVKGGPDSGAQIAACRKAGWISVRSVLCSGASADTSKRDAKRRQPPVVERGDPTERPRVSESAWAIVADWSDGGAVLQE